MTTPGVMHADPPSLTPTQAEEVARSLWGVEGRARPLVSERDQNFAIDPAGGGHRVLKVSNPAEDPRVVEMETAAIEHVAAVDPELPVPRALPTREGVLVGSATIGGVTHLVRLLPELPGRRLDPRELDAAAQRSVGVITGRLSRALRGFFHPAAGRVIEWDQQRMPHLVQHAALVEDPRRRALLDRVLARFADRAQPAFPGLRSQVIHNDLTLDNLLFADDGRVTGAIDFGDMAHTALVLDVPATLQSLLRDRDDLFDVAGAFLAGYTSVVPLEAAEAELLGDLLAGRMAQTILISAWRTRRYPENAYITGWAEPAWTLLEQLESIGLDEAGRRLATLAGEPPVVRGGGARPSEAALLDRRRRVLGRALAPLSYRRPLHLVRGRGAWLEDADGRRYLDAYNNVPVVGHAHPRVTEAIGRQAATLNSNTRYLHAAVVELAERIAATLPDGLDTVTFVNSGSEANDLAWRLATAATGRRGALVTAWAYHGGTAAIDDLSPSEWRGGRHPEHVATLAPPDTFRASWSRPPDPAVARSEAEAALHRLAEHGERPAALYLDSLFTSDGIFAPEPAVVRALLQTAREAGALIVADEVQSGHGRTGDGLWGFAAWNVAPDIVTLGKPMGNGHPIAAVATRAELADRLAAETQFFSTFGGNPVACAAALTVLDVIGEERLVERASEVGSALGGALSALAPRHPAIADVRGRGLMIGVELIVDGEPATALAVEVANAMRERGVLVGTTRREANVLKIRPPLVIGPDEAQLIVEALDASLTALGG